MTRRRQQWLVLAICVTLCGGYALLQRQASRSQNVDANLADQVVGQWRYDRGRDGPDDLVDVWAIETFKADGTADTEYYYAVGGKTIHALDKTTHELWHVKDRQLVLDPTDASGKPHGDRRVLPMWTVAGSLDGFGEWVKVRTAN